MVCQGWWIAQWSTHRDAGLCAHGGYHLHPLQLFGRRVRGWWRVLHRSNDDKLVLLLAVRPALPLPSVRPAPATPFPLSSFSLPVAGADPRGVTVAVEAGRLITVWINYTYKHKHCIIHASCSVTVCLHVLWSRWSCRLIIQKVVLVRIDDNGRDCVITSLDQASYLIHCPWCD